MSMTDAEIREALARAERATPGPWEITAGGGHKAPSIRCPESYHACGVNVVQTDRSVISSVSYTNEVCEFPVQDIMGTPEAKAVAEFIAHARTDVPRLAADLLAARAERDEARQRAERFLQEINRLGQCAEDARDGERREYARAEAAETELAELRRWKDTHSVGSTLRTRAETAERERDEARAAWAEGAAALVEGQKRLEAELVVARARAERATCSCHIEITRVHGFPQGHRSDCARTDVPRLAADLLAARAERDEARAALRAEVDRLHTQRGDDAQQLIDFAATLAIAEEDASWDALRARVAALEAVVLAARRARRAWITTETAHDFAEPALAADALDAALAALEVPRG